MKNTLPAYDFLPQYLLPEYNISLPSQMAHELPDAWSDTAFPTGSTAKWSQAK